ncbi:Hypothetical predicted protein [Lynx pardinus]|uniref:Uncharacterized protein n=1 Tax=Lynx pardinus TaxID=191816 RepID=A0A485NQE0_LYNPA|nr:Hypothetical predicted protein [Lynx pardinus]
MDCPRGERGEPESPGLFQQQRVKRFRAGCRLLVQPSPAHFLVLLRCHTGPRPVGTISPRRQPRKMTYPSPTSDAHLAEPGPPARTQSGTRSDHPDDGSRASLTTTRKWYNSFRGRLARGGKLFPRARISEVASAAAAVVSPVTTATRGKQPRLSGREVSAAPGCEIGKGLGLSAGGARFSCLPQPPFVPTRPASLSSAPALVGCGRRPRPAPPLPRLGPPPRVSAVQG